MSRAARILAGAILLSSPLPSQADPAGDDGSSELDLFALESELNAETRVASQKARSIRETPGVVTVLTREEILSSGARDFIDVLRLVPGFHFGVDVQAGVGVGFRGLWGHEGKVLLLIDGQEMNEDLYSTLQFGQHYPVEHIQRVEIIRGPGSAIYGGYAELAVINVITREARDLEGVAVAARYGQLSNTFGHRSLSLAWGQKFPEADDLAVTLSGTIGQGNRSGRLYQDFFGNAFSTVEASRTDPGYLNLGVSWRDLHVRVLYDHYGLTTRDGFDEALPDTLPVTFQTFSAEARYDLQLGDRTTVTPRLGFKRSIPWNVQDQDSVLYYDKSTNRITGRLTVSHDFTDALNLVVGGELRFDQGLIHGVDSRLSSTFKGEREIDYQNRVLFAELLYEHWLANLIVGARVENHSAVGTSFVPRVAITKLVNRFHFKALYSHAFRAPGFENINLADGIRPENTQVLEAEAGYQLTDAFFLSANVFDITLRDPIVYFYDDATEAEGYENASRTGTRGVEASLRFRRERAQASLSWSWYRAIGNQVDSYAVEDHPTLLLGFPAHKVTLSSSFNVWRELHVSPSAVFMSERFGFTGVDDAGEAVQGPVPPAVLLNLFVWYRDLGVKGLELGAGVHDLLDQAPVYLQPFDGGHAPWPSSGREVMVRLSWSQ